jgi:hypothetical protein
MRRLATSESAAKPATLSDLIARGTLDLELASLIAVLAEHGLPVTVAAPNAGAARELRSAVAAHVLERNPARDALAGGVVLGSSLEDVLRILGGAVDTATGEMADESRDVGVVVVLEPAATEGNHRVKLAHYIRPVERDGAGHIQRRPPALLSAWNDDAQRLDHFYWASTDELATRAGLDRLGLEDAYAATARRLAGADSRLGPSDARH